MPNWMSYVYCTKCDRPLRIHESRSETNGGGDSQQTSHYCRLCDTRGRKPMSIFGFNLWNVIGCSVVVMWIGIVVWYYFLSKAEGLDVTVNDMLQLFLALLLALPLFAVGWWQKSKCKPIYDRWIMRHGSDPEHWPGLYGRK